MCSADFAPCFTCRSAILNMVQLRVADAGADQCSSCTILIPMFSPLLLQCLIGVGLSRLPLCSVRIDDRRVCLREGLGTVGELQIHLARKCIGHTRQPDGIVGIIELLEAEGGG